MKYGNCYDYSRVGQEPYDSRHIILPEIMKDNGYTTGMFGKWAGGYEGSESTPDRRGIDVAGGDPDAVRRQSAADGEADVARRARQISIEAETFHEPLSDKPVTLAIREVAEGKLAATINE